MEERLRERGTKQDFHRHWLVIHQGGMEDLLHQRGGDWDYSCAGRVRFIKHVLAVEHLFSIAGGKARPPAVAFAWEQPAKNTVGDAALAVGSCRVLVGSATCMKVCSSIANAGCASCSLAYPRHPERGYNRE